LSVWLVIGDEPMSTEEPDELVAHVRICGEGAG
jgi:hypothetical protein